MKRGIGWPIGIAVTLGLVVVSNVSLAVVASNPSALVVEADYYRKAVHYDDVMRQDVANSILGWQVMPTLGGIAADSGAVLSIELSTADGTRITGATVDVVAMHNAIANAPVTARLEDAGDGAYTVRLPVRRTGQWQFRFDIHRGSDRFTADIRLDAARATGI